ncbi:DUF3619 family protein [Pseudoduganella sp. UC29_106]|uniref:DUF3619 family protein n=1 Tax=Pseudoduganella sp. UC29_106 TaxID=3374553 RepID=UPI003757FDD1
MNTEDINFAYRVRHALNEKLDDLPASTTDRLAAARKAALARKKADAPARVRVTRTAPAVAGGAAFFSNPFAWIKNVGVALPLLLVMGGMVGVYQFEQQQSIAELAEMDAAVLSDELPLSAYLDHGFNAYLETREQ